MTNAFLKRNLRRFALLATCFAAVGACTRPSYTYSDDVPVVGTGAVPSFTGTPTAGVTSTSGGGPSVDPCSFNRMASGTPVLAGQAVGNQAAGRAEVYAEVTDAEAAALKQGGSLIPAPAQAGMASSTLSMVLSRARGGSAQVPVQVFNELMTRFTTTRSTWPNPWALRLVDHAGSEHMNPVRIVFKPEAWILRITDTSPAVVDLQNRVIAPELAAQSPARIVAVYYRSDAFTSLASTQCDGVKRELALGNEAMVESFSLGTKEILARLSSDIDALNAFFSLARSCTAFNNAITPTFHSFVGCTTWGGVEDHTTEFNAYAWSLATPVELYKPTPQNLAGLISALEADRFTVDPFVGTPPPTLGAGGEGGASGGTGGAPTGGAPAGGAPSGGAHAGGGNAGMAQGGI